MMRLLAGSLTVLTVTAGIAWADYSYNEFNAAVRRAADPNGDGQVSRSEFAAFHGWTFSDFDSNADGVLAGNEFNEFVEESGIEAAACDANMDYRFTGTELQCVAQFLP